MNVSAPMFTTTEAVVYEEESVDEYKYILPVIVFFGLLGNFISLVTILNSRLRHVNANVYLIVLTTADSVFLVGLMLVCLKVDWISYVYCVSLEYVLMTASYVSSWATAFLTIERYMAIAHPLRHVRYGHVDRARTVFYWLPIPFVLQLFQFISLVPNTEGNVRACRLKEANYQILAQALDTLLCYVIPCAVIVVLNILVAFKLRRSASFGSIEFNSKISTTSRRQGGNNMQSGAWTRILWVMPLVFVVLNTPFYVIMMVEVVSQVLYDKDADLMDRSQLFVVVYNAAHYLYYLNSAIDVLVYAFSSANFRKTAVISWKRILCSNYKDQLKSKNFPAVLTEQMSRYSYRQQSNASSCRGSRTFGGERSSVRRSNDTPLMETEVTSNVAATAI